MEFISEHCLSLYIVLFSTIYCIVYSKILFSITLFIIIHCTVSIIHCIALHCLHYSGASERGAILGDSATYSKLSTTRRCVVTADYQHGDGEDEDGVGDGGDDGGGGDAGDDNI